MRVDQTLPNPSSAMIIYGCSFGMLLLLSSFRARSLLERVNAVHILTGSEVLFLLNWRPFRSLRRHTRNDLFFLRQVIPQLSVLLSRIRQLSSNPLQFGFLISPRFDQPIAAFNMFVVPADGLLRDLPGVFVVAEDVGDGQSRKVQSTLATHALDTH